MINPIFSNLGLRAACWACFMCHHELWPTSVSHPFSSLNRSLDFAGGKHHQKIAIPIFWLVLQNFAISGCFPYILFCCYLLCLLSSGYFVVAVCGFISVQGATVGTPYNTAPYITGSNIARLGHGSQNSWSKLWIPIMKSAPVRVIFTWKSVPKKSIHGSSDIYLGTQWKQRHDSPWSYHLDVIVTFLWYGTIDIIWHRDHQSTAKKV